MKQANLHSLTLALAGSNHAGLTVHSNFTLYRFCPLSSGAQSGVCTWVGPRWGFGRWRSWYFGFWLLVVHKRKKNIAPDGTSKSDPLLKHDQTRNDLQRDNTPNAPLCSVCAKLDLRQILLEEILMKDAIPLGSLLSILQKSDQCGFCRLVSLVVRRTWLLDKFPDLDLSGIECGLFSMEAGCLREPRPEPKKLCHRLLIDTSHRPREIHSALMTAHSALTLHIQVMEEDAFKFDRPTDLHGRRVNDTVDVSLVKKWIELCEEGHGDICEKVWWVAGDRRLPEFMRVVDVVSMAVVPAPPACRYAALSYLWGGIGAEYWTTKDNIGERSTPGGLNTANFPDTIADTIQLVRQLGERYLWIDTLCIIQDDLKDKMSQIHAMDLIYGESYFTIYAAGGTSARDPLPGHRPGTRTLEQHIEVVQGLHLSVPLPTPREVLTSSAWSTRGWTYQELMLSRRRIYFTRHQVYFECRHDIFCEDLVAESKRLASSKTPLRYKGAGRFTSGEPGKTDQYMSSYMPAIAEYTRRNLTVESDIVDAITALTNALAKRFELGGGDPARAFLFGMSLMELDHALLWQHHPHVPQVRRSLTDEGTSPWPSWAWAAWRGAVHYQGENMYASINTFSTGPVVAETLIDVWHIVDSNGVPAQLDVRRISRAFKLPKPQAAMNPYSSPQGIDPSHLTLDIHRPLEPGTLIFRTTSSRFSIARREHEESSSRFYHDLFNIFSSPSFPSTWVGSVILPLDPAPPDSLEFIVLSRASAPTGVYDEENFGKSYHGCMLYVMAVSQNEGLMERVGLGIIHETAWIASGAQEKVVFLR
ncbi:heterokaryon incompatibility protein-domain-containing protein [Suillus clintonianus]|uniref:heterokaryon incompatibility protein-domain-containing protein n=1 Tax=Suillus clintonianus TaxID=1904413 RepID=UPI001B87C68C|nr:heterokaryon incompatibility protein-domain-containing protein [Suillus clintonianus]KAG2125741.1 heterokaryon incompatibility protein-domain-containing protein [Suillus clintonianus]